MHPSPPAPQFKFFALNSDTSQIAVPAPIANMRGASSSQLMTRSTHRFAGEGRAAEHDQVTTAVFFRNRIN